MSDQRHGVAPCYRVVQRQCATWDLLSCTGSSGWLSARAHDTMSPCRLFELGLKPRMKELVKFENGGNGTVILGDIVRALTADVTFVRIACRWLWWLLRHMFETGQTTEFLGPTFLANGTARTRFNTAQDKSELFMTRLMLPFIAGIHAC